MNSPASTPMGHPHDEADFWTKVIEGTVHLVEKLCPPLEHSLQWDFSDCGPLLSIEDECSMLESDAATALTLKMGNAVPNAAGAA